MIFLKIRKIYKHLVFMLKKLLYKINNTEYNRKFSKSFRRVILIELIKKMFVSFIIVILLFYVERKVKILQFEHDVFNEVLFSDLLIAAVGIAGVFLGLYCSNMMSIFTSRYMNAPEILISLFEKDILVNKCIKAISNFLIVSILILAINFMGISLGALTVLYCLINAIVIIISYGLSGRRTFQISDIFNITQRLYWDIDKAFNDVSKNKYFCKDINFQNHYKKIVHTNIEYIEEIIEYAIETTNAKEVVMKNFLYQNMGLIDKYWKIKNQIPYNSYWYEEKMVYSRWHKTDDTKISLAIRTGTAIPPTKESDYFYIEDLLNGLNKKCLSVFLEDNKFENLYKWIKEISTICESAVESNSLKIYMKYLDDAKRMVCESIESNKFSGSENQALVDILMIAYVNLIQTLRKSINNIDISSILSKSLNICDKDFNISGISFFNHQDIAKLHRCILTEIKIEKHKITPDWYIKQVVARHIYEHMVKIYMIIDEILNSEVPKLSEFFLEKKHYPETMLIYSRMTQLKTKSKELIFKIEKNIELLKEYHIEKSIIWEDNPVSDFREKQEKIFSNLPKKWTVCSAHFSIENFEDISEFPDYIGECFNRVCEFLITALEEEDFDSFSMAYKNWVNLSFLYQDVIRKDMISVKEPYKQDAVFNVMANPIIELGDISGYAYIIGEMSGNDCWKKHIEDVLEEILEKFSSENISKSDICEKMSVCFGARRITKPFIYNRDVLHSEWKRRIEIKIIESDYLEWECQGYIRTLKNKSNLLNAIINNYENGFVLVCEPHEIFAIKIVNKYLEEDKRFKTRSGWECELNV